MFAPQLLVCDPYFDVVSIGGLKMMHESCSADRPDDVERPTTVAEMRAEPSGQPKVGNTDRVIAVEMRQQQRVNLTDRNTKLEQPDCRATAGVDQKGLVAGLDKRAWTEAIGTRDWHPRPEQRNL